MNLGYLPRLTMDKDKLRQRLLLITALKYTMPQYFEDKKLLMATTVVIDDTKRLEEKLEKTKKETQSIMDEKEANDRYNKEQMRLRKRFQSK